jgi:hypothetical protein
MRLNLWLLRPFFPKRWKRISLVHPQPKNLQKKVLKKTLNKNELQYNAYTSPYWLHKSQIYQIGFPFNEPIETIKNI